MRIIGGYLKGKKILEPKDKETRPLKDLTKESIFNILKHSSKFKVSVEDSIVLDLFSGVGSFGLECLSRGAKHVTFVENYNGVLPILKKNLSNLKNVQKYKINDQNLLKNFNFKIILNKFDIIFLDPPYKEKKINILIDNICENKILNENGIIIFTDIKRKGWTIKNFVNFSRKKYEIWNNFVFLN